MFRRIALLPAFLVLPSLPVAQPIASLRAQEHTSAGAPAALPAAPGLAGTGRSAPAAPQQPRLLQVDDLFRTRRVGAPRVSPDGKWIAYTVTRTSLEDEKSYTRIWMVAADGGEAIPMTADKKPASSPEWSPDGRYLTFLSARDGGKTQVWALDRRGGEAFPLTDVEQGVGGYRWSPDASRILLAVRDPEEKKEEKDAKKKKAPPKVWVIDRLQFKRDGVGYLTGHRHTHLYVFDVATKEMRRLTKGRWDESLGVWSPDGARIAFVSNRTEEPDGNNNTDLWIVRADLSEPTDAPRRVTSNAGADAQPRWSPDGRMLTYVTTIDVPAMWYATSYVAVIPADGGEPRILTRALDRNPRGPRFSDDGRWIWFGLEDSAEDHLVRIHPDGSGLERPVSGALSAFGFDWAGGTFAAQVNTLDRPAEIFVVEGVDEAAGAHTAAGAGGTGRATLRRVTHHNDDFLSSVRIGETRDVHFRSRDGTEIEGFVTFPPDFEEGRRYPTLLRIHGGPVSQFRQTFSFETQLFAAHGYVVVRVNPRGSSGYGQAFSQAIFADWGNKDYDDVMAGVDYAIAQGWADPDRLGVGGWSYGGILTDHVIVRTDRFKAAITGASEVLYIANYGHDHYQLAWEQELGLPWEDHNRRKWERISPFNKVERITTPTLIMGGEKDWNVPIQNGEQLYQALRRRGVPTELIVYPGQGHGIRVPAYQKDRYERYLKWYDRWVKGKTGSAEPTPRPG